MGYTLNNLGLGPGPSLKNADYVQKLTESHRVKVENHKKRRNEII